MVIYWCFSRYLLSQLQEYSENPERYFSVEELNEYRRFVVPKRKTEWLASRILIKRLVIDSLKPTLSLSPRSIIIRKKPSGVPYVELARIGKLGWLSMSHSNEGVLAAFSSDEQDQFGVDLEYIEERLPHLVTDYFTEAEARWVKTMQGEEKKIVMNLIWSAKETYLKAIGKGLQIDTRRIEIKGLNSRRVNNGWCVVDYQSHIEEACKWEILYHREGDFIQTMCIPSDIKISLIKIEGDFGQPM